MDYTFNSGKLMRTPPRPLGEASSQPDLFHTPSDLGDSDLNVNLKKRKYPVDSTENITRTMNDMVININSMLQDLKANQNEQFSQIRKDMSALKKQNDDLLTSNAEIKKTICVISDEQNALKLRVEKLEQGENKAINYVSDLEQQVESLEWKIRETSVEIRNLPTESSYEKMLDVIKQLHQTLNVTYDQRDIRSVYRLPAKQDGPRTIVLEYAGLQKKSELLQAYKKHNQANKEDRLSTNSVGLLGVKKIIYINGRLTRKAQQLHYQARQLVKDGSYRFCWTARGKVFVKKDEGEPIIEIKTVEQMVALSSETRADD
ncbi:Zinc finger DNA binding protein [Operophtera brumata]|uniref:Zinc finger DNA binding protein n=1 Tax=Operophtera brumata TaxID=104452 RepID=A0A0L7KY55_OPEBR|nr:Zinc finger DNA binding protein [Operophtera brumata]